MSDLRPFFRSSRLWGPCAIVAAFAADQAHKFFMLYVFDIGMRQPIRATPFLDIVLSWNFGVSYSLFAAQNEAARYALLAVQLVIIAGLAFWMWRTPRPLFAIALGMIIGGALGNVADRLTYGAVADFFFFHTKLPVGPLANYVFNLADVAIFCGVVLLFLESFAPHKSAPQSPAAA
jgi:signal peptidase II